MGSYPKYETTLELFYTIMILHRLSIYTSMKHSLLQSFETALALQSLDTLFDIGIKAFTLLWHQTGCLKIEAQALFQRFGVENVSYKYILIINAKSLLYSFDTI